MTPELNTALEADLISTTELADYSADSATLNKVLHSKIPGLENFIDTIRDSKVMDNPDYDRTYDRDNSSNFDRGTHDRDSDGGGGEGE